MLLRPVGMSREVRPMANKLSNLLYLNPNPSEQTQKEINYMGMWAARQIIEDGKRNFDGQTVGFLIDCLSTNDRDAEMEARGVLEKYRAGGRIEDPQNRLERCIIHIDKDPTKTVEIFATEEATVIIQDLIIRCIRAEAMFEQMGQRLCDTDIEEGD